MGELRASVKVIDTGVSRRPLSIVEGEGTAHAVLWPENGAHFRSFNLIELAPGARTVDLRHDEESAYYVRAGSGAVRDLDGDAAQDLVEGSMIHIGAGDAYRFEAGTEGLVAIGGTVPVDPGFYSQYLE